MKTSKYSEKTKTKPQKVKFAKKNISNSLQYLITDSLGLKNINEKNSLKHVIALRKYYQTIISLIPENVYWINRNHIFLGCNNNVLKQLGLKSINKYIGKTYQDFYEHKEAENYRKIDEKVMASGKDAYLEEPSKKFGNKIFLPHKTPIFDENKRGIEMLGTSIDITEKKKSEDEMRKAKKLAEELNENTASYIETLIKGTMGLTDIKQKSPVEYANTLKKYYETILAKIPGNVYWMNRNHVFLGCNDNVLKWLGLSSKNEYIGKSYDDFYERKLAKTYRNTDENVMTSGKEKYLEESGFTTVGGSKTHLTHKVPLFDENNKVIGMLGISIDITERKEMEEKLKQAEIKEKSQEKQLFAMKVLAASITHELRSPLRSILNASKIDPLMSRLVQTYEMAKEAGMDVPLIKTQQLKALSNTLQNISDEAYYSSTIINMLLNLIKYFEKGIKDLETYSMLGCIKEAVDSFPFQPMQKKLVHYLENNDFYFKGDKDVFKLILFNLSKNSLFYLDKGDKSKITIRLKLGKKCNSLHFIDNGQGISDEIRPNIFDLWFTKTENGSGIGLAFCKSAMKDMGGDIINITRKTGTEFRLTFPCINQQKPL